MALVIERDVLIVSANPQTRDDLRSYLSGVGLAAESVPDLEAAVASAGSCRSVVIFPDEFGLSEARETIEALRELRPGTRLVVVTATGTAFGRRADASLVILPKPAFSWTILDAVRAPPTPEAP